MLMTAFTHSVAPCSGGHDIVLTRSADGKSKRFFLAGERSCERLVQHMDSLTDGQCEMFFDDAKQKGRGKKDRSAPKGEHVAA